MTPSHTIEGPAAVIAIDNLDTDQIMPKQFLRGIDKAGLDLGLLWDLRFHADGSPRPDFVLNRPAFAGTRILIGGANFGCGSSREHAVWGLQQYGIAAVIAPSFGEIFYSNAMNNGLLALMLAPTEVQALISEAGPGAAPLALRIDLQSMLLSSAGQRFKFELAERHRRMLLDRVDLIGATLNMQREIDAFSLRHWAERPWLRDVALQVRQRLGDTAARGSGFP
jgi:3-isopropylmalate/(R)-2-methylmalate dehydratase small subunit